MNIYPVLIVLISTIFGALGTLLIKKGTNKYSFFKLYKSKNVIIGFIFYGLSTIFYLIALSKSELSIIYPFVSTVYIWTTLLSFKYLNEKVNSYKLISLIGIIIGITLIGLGS